MVADPGPPPARQAEGALELGAAGQEGPLGREREVDRVRHPPPRAADHDGRARRGRPHHRVVRARGDRAVVEQDEVGDAGQALQRVLVAVGDRLVRDVAAGHHQRPARVAQQQVVERRVGQHHAEVRRGRRHRGRHRRPRPPRRHDDRPVAAPQQALVRGAEARERPRRLAVGGHHRERLLLPALARPQPRDRPLVLCPAGKVEAPDPLHGDDRALVEGGRRPGDRVVCQLATRHSANWPPPHEPGRRAALRAGVGLGVEAAVGWVLVLCAAAVAHGEAGHRGALAVVWDAQDDREAGAAGGAVDEGVAVAAVGRVAELGQAVVAGGGVGRDGGGRRGAALAGEDGEAAIAERGHLARLDPLDARQGRGLAGQPLEEALDGGPLRLDLDHHAAGVVENEAGEAEVAGQAVDVGAEAHPLDRPLHPHAHAAQAGAHGVARSMSSLTTCQALAWASWMRGMCSERVMTTTSARPSAAIRPPS